jgi:hypothetical protein
MRLELEFQRVASRASKSSKEALNKLLKMRAAKRYVLFRLKNGSRRPENAKLLPFAGDL